MAGEHNTVPVQVWADVDEGVADLVKYLNTIPGVRTHASCQGTIGEGGAEPYPPYVMATYQNAEAAMRLQKEFRCEDVLLTTVMVYPLEGWIAPEENCKECGGVPCRLENADALEGAASPAEGPTCGMEQMGRTPNEVVTLSDIQAKGPKSIPHCPKPACGGSVVFNRVKHGVPFMSCTKCHAAFPCATAEDFIKFFTAGPKPSPRCPKCRGNNLPIEHINEFGCDGVICKSCGANFNIASAADFAQFFTPSARAAHTSGYLREVTSDLSGPSCHVCGAIMVRTVLDNNKAGWRCLSCESTTGCTPSARNEDERGPQETVAPSDKMRKKLGLKSTPSAGEPQA